MNLITLLAAVTLTFHGQEKGQLTGGLYDNTCTAVVISENMALSASHCVEDVPMIGKLTVVDDKGKKYSAHLVLHDKKKDLAVFRIDHKFKQWAALGAMPAKGDKVYTYNSGEDIIGTYNEGIVCNIFKDKESGNNVLLTNVLILPGASGSGLFNFKGELIGINQWVMKTMTGSIDIKEIRKFLRTANVPHR